jgi:hypothetical protein
MTFTPVNYRQSIAYYEETWKVMDNALYRLCRENPNHARRSSVCAKLWIIGRTYATGIERKVATAGTQGSSMSQVTEHFLVHADEIDDLFSELRPIIEPLDPSKLKTIVHLHGRLVKLLCPITRKAQSTRSFVSKYMHFHNPAAPIYDSVATAALRSLLRWHKGLAVFQMPSDADEAFGRYVMRFYGLYEQLRCAGLRPTVHHVDHYLLSLAESSYTGTVEPVGTEAR